MTLLMVTVEVWNWPDGKLQYGGGDKTIVVETQQKNLHRRVIAGRQTANEWLTPLCV
jgi:hypothetical protein